jgi:hypothetical protein
MASWNPQAVCARTLGAFLTILLAWGAVRASADDPHQRIIEY